MKTGKSTAEERVNESDPKNKQVKQSKSAQIKSLKKQVLVADQEAVEKVPSANEKLDISLAREETTKAASQKMIDVLKINSKSKLRRMGSG